MPTLELKQWEEVFAATHRSTLERLLTDYLKRRQWLSKPNQVRTAELTECIDIHDSDTHMLCVRVEYTQGDPATYLLFVSYAFGEAAQQMLNESSPAVLARLQLSGCR